MNISCGRCGGIIENDGQMVGEPCSCYHCTMQEHIDQQSKYGYAIGALIGLRYSVSPEVRERIEAALTKLGEKFNP